MPDRLRSTHYDLVATTTFHADEAQALAAGQVPVIAMLVGPGYMELVHEVVKLPPGSRVGAVCASAQSSENIAETLRFAGATGVDIVAASLDSAEEIALVDRTADLILMSREALALGLEDRFERTDRMREWTYEFDPSGLELLRRAIDHVSAARRTGEPPAVEMTDDVEARTPVTASG
jgi:rhodanese-related sulfurtransferase